MHRLTARRVAWHCVAMVAPIGFLLPTVRANDDWQPYEARVSVARAQVRSGPGENFYPTSALAQGETVEVYRDQSSGWLAIRPPHESFSWVAGRQVTLRGDGLAEINEDNVASRIGSQFGGKRNAVQVRLRPGEFVEVLGEERAADDTWYKIAPPAGEFRWIQANQVTPLGPLAQSFEDVEAEPIVAASATEDNSTSAEPSSSVDEKTKAGDTWRASQTGRSSSARDMVPQPLAPVSNSIQASEPAAAVESQPLASATPKSVSGGEAIDVPRQLIDLELQLSHMVAAPPHEWNTEPLDRAAEELLGKAKTPADREAINALIAKLDRFEAIARQSKVTTGNSGQVAGQLPGSPAQAPSIPVADGGQPTAESSKYDAVGVLRPVVSKRPGAPQFALVDERGQVVSFVTPTPDMNLQPFLGHRVGVVGARGFIPEFHRAHVTAGRITPLNERIVR